MTGGEAPQPRRPYWSPLTLRARHNNERGQSARVSNHRVQQQSETWQRISIDWTVTYGPTRDKSAAWVSCSAPGRQGSLIVWTSGEVELDVGDVATGDVESKHFDVTDREGLAIVSPTSPNEWTAVEAGVPPRLQPSLGDQQGWSPGGVGWHLKIGHSRYVPDGTDDHGQRRSTEAGDAKAPDQPFRWSGADFPAGGG